jgi:hypothetical protein
MKKLQFFIKHALRYEMGVFLKNSGFSYLYGSFSYLYGSISYLFGYENFGCFFLMVGREHGSALYDNGPAGGSACGHGPRTPRYLHPQDCLGGTSQWRRDYSGSTLWEHLQTKQVLSDGAKEFRQLLRIPLSQDE